MDDKQALGSVGDLEVVDRVGGGSPISNPGGMTRDEGEMAFYGKKPQLKRRFGFLSIVGFICSLLATWEVMFAVFLYGFQNGGPAGLIYGYLFCWVGTLAAMASLAELASMMPLAGGQYHWVSILAPPSTAKFLSYITGWLTVIAWEAGQASVAFLGATIIQGLIILNQPTYAPTRWQGTLLYYAVLACMVFINTFLARWLPKIEGIFLCFHIIGFFAVLIPLVYLGPHGSAKDVFATFINGGNWSSDGLSFFVGIIASVYTFTGADSANHMAEEVYNASTVVPWAIVATIMVNGVLGLALLIALLFCLGDVTAALNTPTGFPFIEIFAQATNSNAGATTMTCLILLLLAASGSGCMATASRLLWSFSRDNAVPFSGYISRVHPSTGLPLYSILVTATVAFLLALINIGSTAAFNAILSVVVAGFMASYSVPIALILHKRLRNDPVKDKLNWGPWHMGPILGPLANAVGLIYIAIALFFSFWPSTVTVTAETMNWSCLLIGATIIFSIVYYMIYGRHVYKWPIVDTIRRGQ
ncbi:amino acid transporter-like protein [Hyaloscypha variabilis F]|uniref:Amino acid transporter-like protein n=1 Tax=Hyaloscypha variabilis (strain UAMH 11265 / GT02V1 / F) TaxID=1149755 RepID=A0A2J6R0B6_HYAVF|nr:amino acid transporter-like protein [Hyaloscypha variabilis F]